MSDRALRSASSSVSPPKRTMSQPAPSGMSFTTRGAARWSRLARPRSRSSMPSSASGRDGRTRGTASPASAMPS
ncbi:hypothetical protein AB0C87_29170 [Actinomadura sp. NPDC048021]|uniref:hypothetical protein n=1 Tax=Actinomadura sp. NPDC048021 TaxID=3155385 RepID=UPI0034001C22